MTKIKKKKYLNSIINDFILKNKSVKADIL